LPNIPYDTPLAEAATIDGKLCSKGQAGIQLLYDPYRLRRVLKRDGPRGSNRWKTIPFGRAIEEIVGGGKLFAHVKGEKNRVVPGLKEVFALRDPQVAKKMAADIERLKERKMTVAEFQAKHRAHLGALIDPDQPDLGPKNNQFVFLAGRIQHGRKELGKRFTKGAFGSVNFYEHTTICEQSHHIATFEMTRDPLTGKGKTHFKPDFLNSEFVIFWGTGAFEANFGLTAMAELVTRPLAERNLKYAVIDPRLSKTAARAWRWVPIIPGADAALALAMTRWVIEKGRFDRRYLENANQAAAKRDGEPTSTDATHLVRADTLLFLRPEDVGLPKREGKGEFHVVMTPEGPRRHDRAEHGLLEVSTTAGGIPVKSVFTLLKERAFERSLDEYAEICGVSSELIEELSTELTGHGKRVAIDTYRGPVQHTNGYYAQQAILALNLLVGSMDWKGGLSGGGGHWHEMGDKPGQPFPLKKLHPGKLKSFGVTLSKERWHYEQSTLFERDRGYPAKRPWYPFTGNVYQEVIPAAGARYPYPIKALWLHKGTPVLSTPGGGAMIPILRDLEAIPLLLADDVVVGETSMYCGYIFPDLSYMERWGTPHDNPQPSTKNSLIRQPIASPIPETV
ncbi:MAG: molybdopterin-dependent oxidoreductase, partial [Nitrospinota bacterium]